MRTCLTAAVIASLLFGAATVQAGWNPRKTVEKAVGKVVDRVVEIDAEIRFRNESKKTIKVVMDNDRETRKIAPGGTAVFGKANAGDAPTFHVLDEKGREIYSRRVGPVGVKASFGFDGKRF